MKTILALLMFLTLSVAHAETRYYFVPVKGTGVRGNAFRPDLPDSKGYSWAVVMDTAHTVAFVAVSTTNHSEILALPSVVPVNPDNLAETKQTFRELGFDDKKLDGAKDGKDCLKKLLSEMYKRDVDEQNFGVKE